MSFFTRKNSDSHAASERTPLLPPSSPRAVPAEQTAININGAVHSPLDDSASCASSIEPKSNLRRRWPSFVALGFLCAVCFLILILGFLVPRAAESYAKQATEFKVSGVRVHEFTNDGVKVGVKGQIKMNASRVEGSFLRLMGRMGTSISKKVSSEGGMVYVYLPDYDDVLLGTATVPPMVIDIRDGHTTKFDLVSDANTGSLDGAKRLVEDYLGGNLKLVRVHGEARLKMKSGILPLGNQLLSETITIDNPPSIPKYEIGDLTFGEIQLPDGSRVVSVQVSASVPNPYEVQFDVPQLAFSGSFEGCSGDPIRVATAYTSEIAVKPLKDTRVHVSGIVPALPEEITSPCSGTDSSPINNFLQSYLHGNSSKVFVSGLDHGSSPEAPRWLVEFLQKVMIPVLVPGHEVGNLIKSFGLSRVHINLPEPGAEPGTPEAAPKLSATVEAIISLPKEVNFPVEVERTKADADLTYLGDKFGEIHIKEWMPATSYPKEDGTLQVQAEIKQVPLNITDYGVFNKVIQKLIFGGGRSLVLGIKGDADVEMGTALGTFAIQNIPATGNVTIKGFPGLSDLHPRALEMAVTSTTPQSISLTLALSVDNPTSYEASIPYVNVFLLNGGYIIGNATVSKTSILPGRNEISLNAIYDPLRLGGPKGVAAASEWLGEYISGKNTTLTVQPHDHSIPSLPELSRALSKFAFTLPVPKLSKPKRDHNNPDDPSGDPDDDAPPGGDDDDGTIHFVESAIMHIFSSTANFIVNNPLSHLILIKSFKGEALYNGSQLGTIDYDLPFVIKSKKEGRTVSPRIPVDWSLGSVAYEAMVDALGGDLRLQAVADVWVEIGRWGGGLRYNSTGVGARIRL